MRQSVLYTKHTKIQRLYFVDINGVESQTILPKVFSLSRISRFDVYENLGEKLQKVLASFGVQSIYRVQWLTLDLLVRL